MPRLRYLFVASIAVFVASYIAAPPLQAQRLGISLKGGTMGGGAEVTAGLTSSLNARVGGSFLPYSHQGNYTEEEVDVGYTADLSVQAASLLLDWHPFSNAFRISGGAFYNMTKVDAVAEPTESYTVKQRTFSREDLGHLSGQLDYEQKLAPYLGLGFGNAVRGSRVDFAVDLGMIYTQSLALSMEGEGMLAPTANQADELEAALSDLQLYPVVSLGVSVRL